MAKDILRQYGPDSNQPQTSSVGCGGVLPGDTKDVMNYQPPYGPKGIMRASKSNDTPGGAVGLGGNNSGNANRPTSTSDGGVLGLGGKNRGNSGSQGRY